MQETADMVYEAFDIADEQRCVVAIMIDGMLGHLMECYRAYALPGFVGTSAATLY